MSAYRYISNEDDRESEAELQEFLRKMLFWYPFLFLFGSLGAAAYMPVLGFLVIMGLGFLMVGSLWDSQTKWKYVSIAILVTEIIVGEVLYFYLWGWLL